MTASMPTFIGRNITAIRPTHDCFYANLGHIMTAFMPTQIKEFVNKKIVHMKTYKLTNAN